MKPRPFFALLAAAVAATACGGDSKSAEAASSHTHADSAGGLVIAPSTPYRASGVEASTALVVNIVGDSASPAPVPPCQADEPEPGTVFWVDGIREGKPLPNERRYTLVNGSCGIEPHVQATVVGGAVNVFNDVGQHRLLFVRAGTTDTLQTMPFRNSGAVVATDRLTKTPGVVEVRCTMHPNERAWIAVFDHPYFGVASAGDKITLDSIPAGDYRVMTWHEGLSAPVSVPARVSATGQTEIILR